MIVAGGELSLMNAMISTGQGSQYRRAVSGVVETTYLSSSSLPNSFHCAGSLWGER